MKTIIGEDELKQKVGIGISNNLELATEEALSSFEPSKHILVNIIGHSNLMLQETTECLEKIRMEYGNLYYTYMVSITKELKDSYVVIICNE